jgi:hypothetical protein
MSHFSQVQRTLGVLPSASTIQVANTPIPSSNIISQLEDKFPGEFKLLKIIGVNYNCGPQRFYDPFLNETRTENFSNVGVHCALVAYATQHFTEFAVRLGKISDQEGQRIVKSALLHDAFKPWDAFYARARRTGILSQPNAEIDKISSEQTISGLIPRGFSSQQASALVSEFDRGLDPREISQKILRVADNGYLSLAPGNFREKLIWLADCMTCSIGSGDNPIDYYLMPLERFILSGSFEKYAHSAQKLWRYTNERKWHEESSSDFAGSTPLFEGNVYDISLILTGLTALELFGDSLAAPSTADALLAAKHLLLKSLSN